MNIKEKLQLILASLASYAAYKIRPLEVAGFYDISPAVDQLLVWLGYGAMALLLVYWTAWLAVPDQKFKASRFYLLLIAAVIMAATRTLYIGAICE